MTIFRSYLIFRNAMLLAVLTLFVHCKSEDETVWLLPYIAIPDNSDDQVNNENSQNKLTYIALGDSYTIGQGVSENHRWPNMLVDRLSAKNIYYDKPRIIARTGWTTDELSDAIKEQNISETFDLVTILIGVNNQFRGRSIDNFRIEFGELLENAIAFANYKSENVIVVSIPDWGVSPYGASFNRDDISKEIDLFNAAKQEIAAERNCKFVNVTTLSRLALNNDQYIATDRLHFSAEMYGLWVEEIIKGCF